ncbi:MAG: hypothetical protein H6562_07520 [Lewinellaceae bacterium]|nr:hypothetical protein [Lewinellaceae bacterium]
MRMLTILSLAALFLISGQVQAQDAKLTKEEKKYWKKQLKDYKKNPEALKDLTLDVEKYKQQADDYQQQLNFLESEKAQQESRVSQLEADNIQLNNRLLEAQNQIQRLSDENDTFASKGNDMGEDMNGIVFKVQIGAYEKTYIPENLDTSESITFEAADGMQKVMVGYFRDYGQAKDLMKHMKKIGLKDAWVVAYQDGVRVDLTSVVPKADQ